MQIYLQFVREKMMIAAGLQQKCAMKPHIMRQNGRSGPAFNAGIMDKGHRIISGATDDVFAGRLSRAVDEEGPRIQSPETNEGGLARVEVARTGHSQAIISNI